MVYNMDINKDGLMWEMRLWFIYKENKFKWEYVWHKIKEIAVNGSNTGILTN